MTNIPEIKEAYVLLKNGITKNVVYKDIRINNNLRFFKTFWGEECSWDYKISKTEELHTQFKWNGFKKTPFVMKSYSYDSNYERIIATGRVVEISSSEIGVLTTTIKTGNNLNTILTNYNPNTNALTKEVLIDKDFKIDTYEPPTEPVKSKKYYEVTFVPFGQLEAKLMENLFNYDKNVPYKFEQMYFSQLTSYGIGDQTDFINILRALKGEKVQQQSGNLVYLNLQGEYQKFYKEIFSTKNKTYATLDQIKNILPFLESLSTINQKFKDVYLYKNIDNNYTSFRNNNIRNLSIAIKNAFYKKQGQDEINQYNYNFDWEGDIILNQIYGNTDYDSFWVAAEDIETFMTVGFGDITPEDIDTGTYKDNTDNNDDDGSDGGDDGTQETKNQTAGLGWLLGIAAVLFVGGMLLGSNKKKNITTINHYN